MNEMLRDSWSVVLPWCDTSVMSKQFLMIQWLPLPLKMHKRYTDSISKHWGIMAFPRISTRHTGSKACKECAANTLRFLTSTHVSTVYVKTNNYLHREGYVFTSFHLLVGWLVCLQDYRKLLNRTWNWMDLGPEKSPLALVKIYIKGPINKSFCVFLVFFFFFFCSLWTFSLISQEREQGRWLKKSRHIEMTGIYEWLQFHDIKFVWKTSSLQ